jgi:hypothetical protein
MYNMLQTSIYVTFIYSFLYVSCVKLTAFDCMSYSHHINLNSISLTDLSSPAKKRKRDDSRVHATGCARTEGFYKIDVREKAKHKVCTSVLHGI